MGLWSDTTDYPALTTATGKQELLRLLLKEAHNAPNIHAIIYRINNTDLTGLTDGATVYDPADSFAST